MNTITITLQGKGISLRIGKIRKPELYSAILDYSEMIDRGIIDEEDFIYTFITRQIQITANNEDIKSTRGKDKKTKNFISEGVTPDSVCVITNSDEYVINEFCISLNDDEVFDPSKVQLIKSDYEIASLPYGYLNDRILYNGKEIEPNDEYDNDFNLFNEEFREIIDYKLPYVR